MADKKTVEIVVDPNNYKGIIALMDRAGEFDVPYMGENELGEKVLISINVDNVTVETWQKNGWCRQNIYWRDCRTEELFNGKWK